MYVQRFYRDWMGGTRLHRFQVRRKESDLLILCDAPLEAEARRALCDVREAIEEYAKADPAFLTSLSPRRVPGEAPEVVRSMAEAGEAFGVGPMAAVAGAVAETVGRRLLERAGTVVVENGGDVFARTDRPLRFALYAGEASRFTGSVHFEVDARAGAGVCTSSGRVGPSYSAGRADAVAAVAASAGFADAAATAAANRIRGAADVEEAGRQEGFGHGAWDRLESLIAAAGDRIAFLGNVRLVPPPERRSAPCKRA